MTTSKATRRSFAPFREVNRRRLSDQVAEALREMILVGELEPAQNITQDQIASELGVSTTPVREAILRLAAQGFVRASPNRSFTVVRYTQADVEDVYWLHEILSSELTRRACDRMEDETLKRIRLHANDLEQAFRHGDTVAMEKANWEFHRTINLAADAPRLQFTLRATLLFIPRHFYELLPSWAERSLEYHEQIIKALDARNSDGAAEATAALVRAAKQAVMEFLSDSGYWKDTSSGQRRESRSAGPH